MSEHAENTFMNTFNRAFVADPVVALEMVESMTGDLMKSIEEKRKAGIKEADPQMVKLQEDHAYLTGLYEDKTEELALHRRAQEAMGISSDFQPNPFEAALGVEEDGFVFFDAPEEPAQKSTSPAAVKAAVSDDVLSNEDLAVMAMKTQQVSQTAAANTQGVDISSFEADEPDLSELDRFTVRKAEGRPQDEPEAPKQHIDELEAFTKKKQQSSGVSGIKKRVSEMFKAKSHAPVSFLPSEELRRMFGRSLHEIEELEHSRKLHFTDNTVLEESAQGLSIVSHDRGLAARRLTMMAKAKGWNSISFEGNDLFLEQAYEEATKAGLVVKPTSEEQEKIFREVHQQRKLDSVMPFGGKREVKDIDKEIENPGHSQAAVPVQAPVYTARIPTRMK
ncbi:LPD7 domain-containing protein [Pantoea agglomerans]|uniref:LPD7 domain-containing protein n=1 Tax=Enterobacter agglomerans TaxID=549 RepID=UPI003C79EC7B